MARQYQSFPDVSGGSDSPAKLDHLRFPKRLHGQSVLDVACNEGFFCQEAWRRKAARVVGIDKNRKFINRAKERDERTEYHVMDWAKISSLDESFDLILSALRVHYAENGRRLLRDLYRLLKPSGILILECGLVPGTDPEFARVHRPAGDSFATRRRRWSKRPFPPGAVRAVGPSVNQRGTMSRGTFSLARREPIVMFVGGASGAGKSTLANALQGDSVQRRPPRPCHCKPSELVFGPSACRPWVRPR